MRTKFRLVPLFAYNTKTEATVLVIWTVFLSQFLNVFQAETFAEILSSVYTKPGLQTSSNVSPFIAYNSQLSR